MPASHEINTEAPDHQLSSGHSQAFAACFTSLPVHPGLTRSTALPGTKARLARSTASVKARGTWPSLTWSLLGRAHGGVVVFGG